MHDVDSCEPVVDRKFEVSFMHRLGSSGQQLNMALLQNVEYTRDEKTDKCISFLCKSLMSRLGAGTVYICSHRKQG
jgi:hypothetical protein